MKTVNSAKMPGASSVWFSVLLLNEYGFTLNKTNSKMKIVSVMNKHKGLPSICPCG